MEFQIKLFMIPKNIILIIPRPSMDLDMDQIDKPRDRDMTAQGPASVKPTGTSSVV